MPRDLKIPRPAEASTYPRAREKLDQRSAQRMHSAVVMMLAAAAGKAALASVTRSRLLEPRALRHVAGRETELAGGLVQKEHTFTCPLDWAAGDGSSSPEEPTINVYCRELVLAKHGANAAQLPCLIYLQGGPGFPAPRPGAPPTGWLARALTEYRVLLLDQRGVGRSTPATVETIKSRGDAEAQAKYLACLRADSIVPLGVSV
ncbi:hypothetical protein T492DRAFT_857862 [Pavlovales sp. CCMP2436]|nr:hypothetical protein T492DRAFT_857862 [Pavlovales sp. CCMP2436]